jgi:hypothetical protein
VAGSSSIFAPDLCTSPFRNPHGLRAAGLGTVYRGESRHPPREFLGINGSKVVKKPYGKYRFMVYFTVTKQDYCEVQSSSLVDALEENIQDEPTDVYIRITSGVYHEINNELNIMYREILDAVRYL